MTCTADSACVLPPVDYGMCAYHRRMFTDWRLMRNGSTLNYERPPEYRTAEQRRNGTAQTRRFRHSIRPVQNIGELPAHEMRVARLLSTGKNPTRIAIDLKLALSSVKQYRAMLYLHLGISRKTCENPLKRLRELMRNSLDEPSVHVQ